MMQLTMEEELLCRCIQDCWRNSSQMEHVRADVVELTHGFSSCGAAACFWHLEWSWCHVRVCWPTINLMLAVLQVMSLPS